MGTRVVDPRPPVQFGRATRRLPHLLRKHVALVDNGKSRSEFGNYAAVFDHLRHQLALLECRIDVRAADLLHFDENDLRQLAADLSTLDAAILGVADTGVSAPTTMLAAELERLGVATVTLSQGLGESVVAGMSRALAPELAYVTLESTRLDSYTTVLAEIRGLWPDIVKGLTQPSLPAVSAPRRNEYQELELTGPDISREFSAAMTASGFGDGLPLIAPTEDRVAGMLAAMSVAAEAEVWPPIATRQLPVTGWDAAALAVMAGCRPAAGRIVLTALTCMAEPAYRLFQAAITTHPSGTLVFVSGPAAEQAGITSGCGSLGPAPTANAAVGRTIALSYGFFLNMRPGEGDITVQGSPAEFSYCTGENVLESPWNSLSQDLLGCDSSVTVLKCEGPRNVLDNVSTTPESLLGSLADTASALGGNNLYVHGAQTMLFLSPEHARIFASRGWTKQDIQRRFFKQARRHKKDLAGRGIAPNWDPNIGDSVPVAAGPQDILVTVTGASGPQSQIAVPWGYSRGVTRPL